MDDAPPQRDKRGLFLPGNAIAKGHGGSRERTRLQRALRAAIDEGTIGEIVADLRGIAADRGAEPGARISAMKVLLEHAVGRPREADDDRELALPTVEDSAGVAAAVARTFALLAAGEVDVADATKLVGALSTAGDVLAWRALEARLAALEAERAMRLVT
ncbi:MAG: hypothetical protein IT457_23995 [Planctomycetes bacterium]|nr:hypothetical protein [Planctomycetota bacterium]